GLDLGGLLLLGLGLLGRLGRVGGVGLLRLLGGLLLGLGRGRARRGFLGRGDGREAEDGRDSEGGRQGAQGHWKGPVGGRKTVRRDTPPDEARYVVETGLVRPAARRGSSLPYRADRPRSPANPPGYAAIGRQSGVDPRRPIDRVRP